jgi:hypothetical protein
MDGVFADASLVAAPHGLAVNRNDLTFTHPKDPFHPAHERRLKGFSIQRRKKNAQTCRAPVCHGAARKVCNHSCFPLPKLSTSTQLSAPTMTAHTVITMVLMSL